MKRTLFAVVGVVALFTVVAGADVIIQMGFDNNTEPNGIYADSVKQTIDFSGGYTGTGESNFNNLTGISAPVNFSVSGLSIGTFSGTITPGGGDFAMEASGGGIDGSSGTSPYFDDVSEYWTFTFANPIVLTDVNYYSPDPGQQSVLINGSGITGSPFDDDITGASFTVNPGQTLTFGYVGDGSETYGMDDFTFSAAAVPEPATLGFMVIGLVGAFFARRKMIR
jgi:hypothetical protein